MGMRPTADWHADAEILADLHRSQGSHAGGAIVARAELRAAAAQLTDSLRESLAGVGSSRRLATEQRAGAAADGAAAATRAVDSAAEGVAGALPPRVREAWAAPRDRGEIEPRSGGDGAADEGISRQQTMLARLRSSIEQAPTRPELPSY